MKIRLLPILLTLLVPIMAQDPVFTLQPTLTKINSTQWRIEFTVDRATDVAVSLVNIGDSTVIRHLAAGMLGATAPSPLAKDSLHQILTWDGTDDFGSAVTLSDGLIRARVRAGMSVRLLNLVGDNPYLMAGSFNGIIRRSDGNLFIAGCPTGGIGVDGGPLTIRQYDAAGVYIRTVFPPAADIPAASVSFYGVTVLSDNTFIPKTTVAFVPGMTSSFLSHSGSMKLLPIGGPGELVMVQGMDMQMINENGTISRALANKIITSPAGPGNPYRLFGPQYFTASHDPNVLYLSGWAYGTVDGGTWLLNALDTGFWADGQVFKVNRTTGAVTPWIHIDSVPVSKTNRAATIGSTNAYSALHGVDIDDSGRVFVCDRHHRQVSVYDTAGALQAAVGIPFADFVTVNRKTGALYVITRNSTSMTLNKFNTWRGSPAVAFSVPLTSSVHSYIGAPSMVLTEDPLGRPLLWTGYVNYGVRAYRDDGDKFTLVTDFQAAASGALLCFDRPAADRRNETVYIQNAQDQIFKIEDWQNPALIRCSTSARQPLWGTDMTVSPKGHLYVREGRGFTGPITRYTTAHLHAPLTFSNTGRNVAVSRIYNRFGAGNAERGLSVSWDGRVAGMQYGFTAGNVYCTSLYPDSGAVDTSWGDQVVSPMTGLCGGVKFDPAGNLYVGAKVRAPGHQIPAPFASDWAYPKFVGAVAKYAKGDSGSMVTSAIGAERVYLPGLAPYSQDGGSACICRTPRFDVDPYGRVFIPNALTCQVTVVDNADNPIVQFGRYGNIDSRGGLSGPGQTIATPAVPLAWPVGVAVTEDNIYVTDMVNCRLARLKMDYALDNLPGLTDAAVRRSLLSSNPSPSLLSNPNPFSTRTTLRITGLQEGRYLKMGIYDLQGRLVLDLTPSLSKSAVQEVCWDGNDTRGRAMAAGVYYARLDAGSRILFKTLILAK